MENTEHLFEIVVTPSGDRAEADTPEDAMVAARTMMSDSEAKNGGPVIHSACIRASIYCDGRLVRSDIRAQDIRI